MRARPASQRGVLAGAWEQASARVQAAAADEKHPVSPQPLQDAAATPTAVPTASAASPSTAPLDSSAEPSATPPDPQVSQRQPSYDVVLQRRLSEAEAELAIAYRRCEHQAATSLKFALRLSLAFAKRTPPVVNAIENAMAMGTRNAHRRAEDLMEDGNGEEEEKQQDEDEMLEDNGRKEADEDAERRAKADRAAAVAIAVRTAEAALEARYEQQWISRRASLRAQLREEARHDAQRQMMKEAQRSAQRDHEDHRAALAEQVRQADEATSRLKSAYEAELLAAKEESNNLRRRAEEFEAMAMAAAKREEAAKARAERSEAKVKDLEMKAKDAKGCLQGDSQPEVVQVAAKGDEALETERAKSRSNLQRVVALQREKRALELELSQLRGSAAAERDQRAKDKEDEDKVDLLRQMVALEQMRAMAEARVRNATEAQAVLLQEQLVMGQRAAELRQKEEAFNVRVANLDRAVEEVEAARQVISLRLATATEEQGDRATNGASASAAFASELEAARQVATKELAIELDKARSAAHSAAEICVAELRDGSVRDVEARLAPLRIELATAQAELKAAREELILAGQESKRLRGGSVSATAVLSPTTKMAEIVHGHQQCFGQFADLPQGASWPELMVAESPAAASTNTKATWMPSSEETALAQSIDSARRLARDMTLPSSRMSSQALLSEHYSATQQHHWQLSASDVQIDQLLRQTVHDLEARVRRRQSIATSPGKSTSDYAASSNVTPNGFSQVAQLIQSMSYKTPGAMQTSHSPSSLPGARGLKLAFSEEELKDALHDLARARPH